MAKWTNARRDARRRALQGLGAGALALAATQPVSAALMPKARKTEKFDVIVIGTGLAGLAAALEARNAGANVLIVEKMPEGRSGGNTRIAGGAIVVPPERSKPGSDAYHEDFVKKSQGKGNAELSRVIADNIFDGVDWMKSYGIELLEALDAPPYRVKTATVAPAQFVGMPAALAKLREAYVKRGGRIAWQTKAKQLIVDDRGRVAGVHASTKSGLVDYLAPATVIATGGYAGNKELLEMFVDPEADEMMVRGVAWATGDGLLMAKEAGAQLVAMGGLASLHVAAVSVDNTASGNPSRAVPFCVGINRDGLRYVDESLGYVAHGKAALKQPGQRVALVFDEDLKAKQGVQISMATFKRLGINLVEADTLEELATRIGAPPAQLSKTIADFNAAVLDGKAMTANPPKTGVAAKIQKPRFYAFYPLTPGITLTFGGVRIDAKARVLEPDGSPIPGLYACGETAGGVYYDDYFAGASLANCLVMGRIAGQSATGDRAAHG